MVMKRIAALVPALIFMFSMLTSLTACNGNIREPSDTTTGGIEQEVATVKVADLSIVRPKNPTDAEKNAAVEINKAIHSKCGILADIADDFLREGETHDSDKIEILVGKTNYAESAEVLEKVAYDEYRITVVGNKIVIVCGAFDADAILDAANEFISRLDSYISGEMFTLDRDIAVTTKVNTVLSTSRLEYTRPVGGNNSAIRTGSEQKVYKNCSVSLYNQYINSLLSAGGKMLAENKIGDNLFTTVENSEKTMLYTAYYIAYTKQIRVVTEPWHEQLNELPSAQNGISCDATLMQLECFQDAMQANVIRLSDGRYVLYDSGKAYAATRLIEYMRENNVFTDGKIHIAAAFLSHPHGDHTEGFIELADKYSDEIVVEAVYANFIEGTIQTVYTAEVVNNHLQDIIKATEKLGGVFVYARTGQKITIGDAVFEILFTPEDLGEILLDRRDTAHDMNNTCLTVLVSIKGQKILFVGDSRASQSVIIANTYKGALSCDIMTVAHHGYNVVLSLDMYTYAQPSVLIWPNNQANINENITRAFVQRLFAAPYVKEHLTGQERFVLTLPYTPTSK